MSSGLIKKLMVATMMALCLLGVSLTQRHLDHLKDTHELVIRERVENQTPTMAFFTGALGGFRGLIADVLFIRLSILQEKEKYFEINELGHLILQLQPDMPQAVAHLAWNMAYNISVKYSSAEDRWRWVRRGIELCRDHGLKYNPSAPVIYHQLGWIFQHKIGQMLDDANLYYKSQLALQMIEVLGQKDRYDWDALAAAPNEEDGLKQVLGRRFLGRLMAKEPELDDDALLNRLEALSKETLDGGKFPEFWQTLFDDAGITKEMKALVDAYADGKKSGIAKALDTQLIPIGERSPFYRFMSEQEMSHRRLEQEFRLTADGRPSGGLPEAFFDKAEELGITVILDDYFRSRWLREIYKVDADKVPAIFAKTGYLDFRLPYAHGIYWAQGGLKFAPEDKSLHRMVQQCLFWSATWGHLQYISNTGFPMMRPNFESIDNYLEIYENQPTHTTGDRSGAENFLKDAIVQLYTWGETTAGRKWFRVLKEKRFNQYHRYKNKTYEQFAMDEIAQDIAGKTQDQVASLIVGYAKRYLEALAFEKQRKADDLLRVLERIRERYYEELKPGSRRTKRIRVPTVFEALIQAKMMLYFESPLPPDVKQRIWNVGPDLRPILEEMKRRNEGNAMDPDSDKKLNIQR